MGRAELGMGHGVWGGGCGVWGGGCGVSGVGCGVWGVGKRNKYLLHLVQRGRNNPERPIGRGARVQRQTYYLETFDFPRSGTPTPYTLHPKDPLKGQGMPNGIKNGSKSKNSQIGEGERLRKRGAKLLNLYYI
ncbi:MAG: hypothetical protein F6J93_08600 [Oscillatoria sp. SIO1A7]|nr:hypothetical protein [Oscillatoria sp. SIO1A7]